MLKTDFIRGTFRKPIKPPPWWEGHVIHFKTYPRIIENRPKS